MSSGFSIPVEMVRDSVHLISFGHDPGAVKSCLGEAAIVRLVAVSGPHNAPYGVAKAWLLLSAKY
jgi:hypothetical protein